MAQKPLVLVCEAESFARMMQLLFDPRAQPERRAALADFFAHDLPDFDGWCERVRSAVPRLIPSDVRLVSSDAELRANLKDADALLVEALHVTRDTLVL
jgi:hypothetical protein